MGLVGETCRKAAALYFVRGYTAMPLGLDKDGYPKRPFKTHWQRLQHDAETVRDLPWQDAQGLGLVLGQASNNLAVLDVDDVECAKEVYLWLRDHNVPARTIKTVRKRLHVYVREQTPAESKVLTVKWQRREFKLELKAKGTQVAAPPTPGYSTLIDSDPVEAPSIGAVFASIARRLSITIKNDGEGSFPKAWRQSVESGTRDNSAFVEACRLREAGMPIQQAIDLLRLRFEQAYEQGGIHWREIERTVRSAYQRGAMEPVVQRSPDEFQLWSGL